MHQSEHSGQNVLFPADFIPHSLTLSRCSSRCTAALPGSPPSNSPVLHSLSWSQRQTTLQSKSYFSFLLVSNAEAALCLVGLILPLIFGGALLQLLKATLLLKKRWGLTEKKPEFAGKKKTFQIYFFNVSISLKMGKVVMKLLARYTVLSLDYKGPGFPWCNCNVFAD